MFCNQVRALKVPPIQSEVSLSFLTNHSWPDLSKNPVELWLAGGGRVSALIGWLLGHVTSPARRRQVLKHGGVVCGEHVFEVGGHGVGPEEVVVESVVAVYSLSRIQNQQFVDEVQSVRVFHISLQSVLHLTLLTFRKLHLLIQLILLIHTGPNLSQHRIQTYK